MKRSIRFLAAVIVIMAASGIAQAVPTPVTWQDGPQDPLVLRGPIYDELGNKPPFPSNEWIESTCCETWETPCSVHPDDPDIVNRLVTIQNMTNTFWVDLHYVADPETSLTNDDGLINGELAFRIDNVGLNQPLLSESMTPDLVFEPGEIWHFVIQDYVNALGLAPSAFGSIGVGGFSGGDTVSSGSIIAVPAPSGVLLLSVGTGLLGWFRRRRIL